MAGIGEKATMAHQLIDNPDWSLALAARQTPDYRHAPGHRLKLLPMDMVSVDSFATDAPKIDVAKMAVTVCISTPTLDQSRDVVVGDGIDTSIHKLNPLVLFMHKPMIPVGRAVDPEGGYSVSVGGEKTYATTHFFQNSKEAEQVFRLIEMGALPGASVGIRPKPGMVKQLQGEDGVPYCVIEGCNLIEFSHVFFPDNPEALVVAVQKGLGGKALSANLMQFIMPLLPARKPVVRGASLLGRAMKIKQVAEPVAPGAEDEVVEETDARPVGAQFGAALYEMAVAMMEFVEENSALLEPETAEAFAVAYEPITSMMNAVAGAYADRYPDLPKLAEPVEDDGNLGPDADPDDSNEPIEDDDVEKEVGESDEPPADDDKEDDEKKALRQVYRTKARAAVRAFWAKREQRLNQTERTIAAEAAEYLRSCSSHGGQWTRQLRVIANYYAKALAKLAKATTQEPVAKTAADDSHLTELTKLLTKRSETIGKLSGNL